MIISLLFISSVGRHTKEESKFLVPVRKYLNTVIPQLFDLAEDAEVSLSKPRIQIVAGYNTKATVSVAGMKLKVKVYTNPKGKCRLTSITSAERAMIGGYRFVNPSDIPEESFSNMIALVSKDYSLTDSEKTLIAVRRQIVSGTNTHYIFEDADGTLHSSTVYTNLKGDSSLTSYRKVVE